jgi:hypothetical protein
VTTRISMALLILSFGTYLLAIGVREYGPAADPLVLIGGVMFAAGLFFFGFTIERFLFIRRIKRHVKGKKHTPGFPQPRAALVTSDEQPGGPDN